MTASEAPPEHFTILYFATAKSYTGRDHDYLPAPLPLHQLFATLEAKYPGMRAQVLESCAVTVNLDYVDVEIEEDLEGREDAAEKHEGVRKVRAGKFVIQVGDEVGIIPPVSSG